MQAGTMEFSMATVPSGLVAKTTATDRRVRKAEPAQARTDAVTVLLQAAGRGDQAAFERLYRLTSSRLLAVALRFLRDRGLAEDVLQESFVAIWQHASDFSPDRSAAATWMTTIVRNRCLDRLRVQPREISVGDDEDGSPFIAGIADTGAGPEELGVERQSRGRFDRILNALPGHYRQALTLAYCHGLTHAEISRHLAIPLGTAKSWVRRGLEEFARRQGGQR